MDNIETIQRESMVLRNHLLPLTSHKQEQIQKDYLKLSPVMRSIAGQVAIQIHLSNYEYSKVQKFIESLEYDANDVTKQKCTNFWYKVHAGRAVTQTNTCNTFFNAIDLCTASVLNHPLWRLVDKKISIERALWLFKLQRNSEIFKERNRWDRSGSLSIKNLKQSYKKQRQKLFEQHTLDSLTELLFIALMQIQLLNHTRPTTAEQFAYGQFLYLFGFKYSTLKKHNLGKKISLLLSGRDSLLNNSNIDTRLCHDLETIGVLKQIGAENQQEEINKYVSNEITKVILSKPNHYYFLDF